LLICLTGKRDECRDCNPPRAPDGFAQRSTTRLVWKWAAASARFRTTEIPNRLNIGSLAAISARAHPQRLSSCCGSLRPRIRSVSGLLMMLRVHRDDQARGRPALRPPHPEIGPPYVYAHAIGVGTPQKRKDFVSDSRRRPKVLSISRRFGDALRPLEAARRFSRPNPRHRACSTRIQTAGGAQQNPKVRRSAEPEKL
jgi:hypothetical protein